MWRRRTQLTREPHIGEKAMNEPVVNAEAIPGLIEGAQGKVREFEEKVKRIDARIRQLEDDRDAVEALLEYVKKATERKSALTGLFVQEFEYGAGEEVHPEIVDQYEERLERRKASIEHLSALREQRLRGIEFAKRDIELLKRVSAVEYWPVYLEAAVEDF